MIKRLFQNIGKRSHNVFVQYALGALYGNFALWNMGAPIVLFRIGKQLSKAVKKQNHKGAKQPPQEASPGPRAAL